MTTPRAATPDDVEVLAALWHAGWRDAHLGHVPEALMPHRRPGDFRERMKPRVSLTTVAVSGARPVGFVTVHGDEVEQLYVSAEARGQGVADALLRHAEQAIAARFPLAWLAVVPGNARARRFYERNGWRDAGAFDYPAETADGTILVPCRRYEKPTTV
ncbi:MAG TPA: GNAT family N-acetyltransferase [Vicinamibacteria bacterium]|nr:GNAT family N-acetyltransferase [Vicinamibacteria bacterium]